MIHPPLQLQNVSLAFRHKICFEEVHLQISYGSRIAIIGRNGSGKSTLLKMLHGSYEPTNGAIKIPEAATIGYVPQIIEDFDALSGGERLNKAVTEALSVHPNILLLDEPTNHLDRHHRASLMRMLRSFEGTLIVVSHDVELLRHCIDTLWHIDNERIHIFSGKYDDYLRERKIQRAALEQELSQLNRQKKNMHELLMREQVRAAKSRAKGAKSIAQKKWSPVVGNAKADQAEQTSGRKKTAIDHKKQNLSEQLSSLRLPEIIVPTFSLKAADVGDHIIVSISDGSLGYQHQEPLLQHISLSLGSHERIALSGDNGTGKSTLLKAFLNNAFLVKSGDWYQPKFEYIGYFDQHYSTLSPKKSVLETISELLPECPHAEVRRHLNDFLFRKNEEVNTLVETLSGGEKARLSLAQIAAKTPKLLLLDEITNNLDLETRAHVIEVLKAYPGAMIVISHDADFLKEIGIEKTVSISKFF
ncbi:MAG: ABC-F family ATP-binding cassette domain-containing protein [Chthoniobacterales bacterium]